MNFDLLAVWPEILCLVPVYTADGTNGTAVYRENGEPIFNPLRTKTLVRQLARVFCLDLKAARQHYAEVSKRQYTVPIPLRPDLVLVPVRARRARVKDDGTRAYVVKAKIQSVTAGPGSAGTRITFKDGTHLDVMQKWESLKVLLAQADLVEKEAFYLLGSRPGVCLLAERAETLNCCMRKKAPKETDREGGPSL